MVTLPKDKVSAGGATFIPRCAKVSRELLDARRGSPIIPINLELLVQWAQVATESLRTHDQKNYMVWIPRPPFSGDSGSNTVSLRLTVPISQKSARRVVF